MKEMDARVLIVGGGPAGAWMAYCLAGSGVDAMIIEKEDLPRYKPCGGALSHKTTELLRRRGALPCDGIRSTHDSYAFYHDLGRPIHHSYPEQKVCMVMRDEFDHHLLKRAVEAGARLRPGERVVGVRISPSGVGVKTDRDYYTGELLVGADGANSTVARNLDLWPDAVRENRGVAVEVEVADWEGRDNEIIIDYGVATRGYAWAFPKGGHLSAGIGEFVLRHGPGLKGRLDRFLSSLGVDRTRGDCLCRGHPLTSGGGPAEEIGLAGKKFLLVGDAAHLVDPFIGEGIYHALRSGELGAEAIVKHLRQGRDLECYQSWISCEIGAELRAARRLARLFYPWTGFFHRLAGRKPEVIDTLLGIIQGRGGYGDLLLQLGRIL